MALALDPFDIEFRDSAAGLLPAVERRQPLPLPPIALCLPTLFGPATFTVPAAGASSSIGEAAEK